MEIVENHLQPLQHLLFGFGTNCGTSAKTSTTPVEFWAAFYIFAFSPADSCLPGMHILHIFWGIQAFGEILSLLKPKYPQTHNLWIAFAVDGQTSPKSAFLVFGEDGYAPVFHKIFLFGKRQNRVAYE